MEPLQNLALTICAIIPWRHSKDQQVQRGYYFAIIDEVDSILIDEARTPLIISGPSPVSRQMYDELKDGVAHLVRRQRDLCNQASRRCTQSAEKLKPSKRAAKKDKKQEEEEQEALQKLWLVSKGTPHNNILMHLKEDPDMRAGIDKWDLYLLWRAE